MTTTRKPQGVTVTIPELGTIGVVEHGVLWIKADDGLWYLPAEPQRFDPTSPGTPHEPEPHPTPPRSVRVPDDVWAAAKAEAERRDETVTAAVVRFLRRYGRLGKESM